MRAGPGNDVRERYLEHDEIGVLSHEVVVPGAAETVWRAYTTSEGLMAWAAPFVACDFRLDGTLESSYGLGARAGDPGNGVARFLAFIPARLLAFRTMRMPAGAPMDGSLWMGMHQVVEMEPRDSRGTFVRQSVVGFGRAAGYSRIRELMAGGNRWALGKLCQAIAGRPVDWPAELGPGPTKGAGA